MQAEYIPYILMVVLVISHSIAIAFLKTKRKDINVTTEEGRALAKRLSLVITLLYIELPVITAIIWIVVKPALAISATLSVD